MSKVDDKKQKLVDKEDKEHHHHHAVIAKDGEKRDPLKIQNISLAEDFYALTWTCMRKQYGEDKEIRGVKITLTKSDYFWLRANFLFFVTIILLTVTLLLWEVFSNDVYKEASLPITILRITLVGFAQKNLAPEFYQGLSELRYTVRTPDDFTHYAFAIFVSICQISITAITFFGIILFVCMADEALDLVIDFAGLSVLAELDDWLGEVIMAEKIKCEGDEDDKNEDYDLEDLNDRVPLFDKMCLVDEADMEIIDDQNFIEQAPWYLRAFTWTVFSLPWQFILPLLTLPVNYLLCQLHMARGTVVESE